MDLNPISIVSDLVGGVVNYFTMSKEKKLELKNIKEMAKVDSAKRKDDLARVTEQARIDRIQNNDNVVANYDLIAQENARTSIMDEIMITWVLTIVTLIFIPDMQPYVINGFEALTDHMPVWFQTIVIGCFIAKLGLRFLFSGFSLFKK